MLLSSITFFTLYLLDKHSKGIFTSQFLAFELLEHISAALRLCRDYGYGSGWFLDGRPPAKWLVHSYLEDKQCNGAGRLLQGASFQTSGSQQSSSTSFWFRASRHGDQSSLSGFLSVLCLGETMSGHYKRISLNTLGTGDENGFVSVLTLPDSWLFFFF